jgi:hypothetical protein
MEIRNYQQGDEVKILDLFKQSFHKELPLEYWKWRFIDNPTNKVMIKLMWDDDILAGHYAVSPLAINIDRKEYLSALSMTTMTHPDYAGRGIFTDLAERMYEEEYIKNDLKAVWGYPNLNSHYAFIKNLKWANLDRIPLLSLNLNKLKNIESNEVSLASQFDVKHSAAYEEVTNRYRVKVKKDPTYLNWRYIDNPVNKYTIFQISEDEKIYFSVAKMYRSFDRTSEYEVDIVELNFPPDLTLLLKLLNKIKDFYSGKNIVKVNLWLPIDDPKHIFLERLGFVCASPVTFMGIRNMDSNLSVVEDIRSWNYCMGDSDVF